MPRVVGMRFTFQAERFLDAEDLAVQGALGVDVTAVSTVEDGSLSETDGVYVVPSPGWKIRSDDTNEALVVVETEV